MKYRGLDDDLSRGPMTTLEFQKKLIRTLAAYKVNLYSPYFEQTQQYASNPLTAPPDGAMTAAEAAELVAYARPYHVTMIPEQEAFGHLHHKLVWEQYQQLAETPHGAVLAPGQPGSIALIKQMFDGAGARCIRGRFCISARMRRWTWGWGRRRRMWMRGGWLRSIWTFMQRIVDGAAAAASEAAVLGRYCAGLARPAEGHAADFKDSTIAIAWVYSPESRGLTSF